MASRLSNTRARQGVITAVVGVIVVGSFVEYRRHRHATPPTVAVAKPAMASPVPPPVVTRTPGVLPLYATAPVVTPAPAPTPPGDPTPAAASAARTLAEATAKANAGDLVAARKLLNDALLSGTLSDADAAVVKKQASDLNAVLVFSSRTFKDDPLAAGYPVKPGDHLSTIARLHGVPTELLMQVNHIADAKRLRAGQTIKVINGPFYAVVSKAKFNMDLFLGGPGGPGSTYVASYPVGLGTDNSTPTGMWEVKNKAPDPAYYSTRGEGVIPHGDPRNPLGPFWLGLEGTEGQAVGSQSYGIHGTTDDSSIGKMASLGCVRLHNDDVGKVYRLLVEHKSKVKVVD